ncbi:MAG: S41 family peptidase [Desulfomonilaceae bacterium]
MTKMSVYLFTCALAALLFSAATPGEAAGEHVWLLAASQANLLIAQRTAPQDDSKDLRRTDTRAIHEGDPKELFLQVIDMIDRYYVRDVSIRSQLDSVWTRLQFGLLPECAERNYGYPDCHTSAEKCFLDSLEELCRECHIDCNYLIDEAVRLLVAGLDAHSSLLDQGMLNELKISTSGTFGGVGMVVASKNNRYVVVSALDGSPAQKAGVKAGDVIVEIDGKPVEGLPLPKVLSMVRGPSGSVMTVLVESPSHHRSRRIKLRRQTIRIAPVRSIMLSHGVGYIRIVNFQEDTSYELMRALSRLAGQHGRPLKGIIIDVRDNPGGLFEEAIKTAGLLKTKGRLTSLKGRNPEITREFYSPLDAPLYEGSLVLLANKGSASGSEVLVGALQGAPNVKVIGQRTFGKASVQGVFALPPALALRLTTAHYYTADGRDIEGKGIDPDVFFEEPGDRPTPRVGALKASDIESDPMVKAALAYLLHGQLPRRSPFPSLF